MSDWNYIVEKYLVGEFNAIRRLSQPVRDHLNVGYFSYHHVSWDGRYSVLLDQPQYAEYYIANKFYDLDPYLRQASVYREGICHIDSHIALDVRDLIAVAGKDVMDVQFGYVLVEKAATGVHFYSYSSVRGSRVLDNVAMRHPEVLWRHGRYFRNEMAAVLQKQYDEAPFLADLKGDDFYNSTVVDPNGPTDAQKALLRCIGLDAEVTRAERLSEREIECLRLLREGMSARQTGIRLGLSKRTIESYLDSVKAKLGCFSKAELHTLADEFTVLGLLP